MERPPSTVRRRAWINSSRQWLTLEDPDSEGPACILPSASIADDDVFSDGCFTGKIEDWLLGCGTEARSDKSSQLSFESVLKPNYSEDELSLGADASLLHGGGIPPETGTQSLVRHPSSRPTSSTPRRALCLPSLDLGQSMASSCPSSSTCKTTSSVSEVLKLCSEDAEETLYELGFGCDEPQVTVRIPPRFFTFPSLAQGINFRLFLDSQLRRIREEDPSLSLASRFRQVQVLTAMANAFYSLYSHVSRTPLQKLATPEFSFSSSPVERIERFRSSVRSEPKSPVERLKDTVSKMCLYTGSSPRGSDSTSPQLSPKKKRSSLPDVVDVVLEKVKTGVTKKLDLGESIRSNSAVDVRLVADSDSRKEEQTQQSTADTDTFCSPNKICHEGKRGGEQIDNAGVHEGSSKAAGLSNTPPCLRTSLASSLSGETVIETDHQLHAYQPERNSTQRTARHKPVARFAFDQICPQIVESAQQAPFCARGRITNPLSPLCSDRGDRSRPGSHAQTDVPEPHERSHSPLPVLASSRSFTQCCITVTGWEGGDVSSCSPNAPDSSHTSNVPPVETCEQSFNGGKSQYLKPHQGLGHISNDPRQLHSFELEEVHSAGEEDLGHSETTRTSPLSRGCQHKGEVSRGDSMQSDSSGYAEEEVSLSYSR